MIDQLVAHGTVQVVGAVSQRRLSGLDTEHDPIRLDMFNIIKHQSANGYRSQIHDRRRFLDMVQTGVLRMKCERNKRLESAGLVL